jgi:hypothetical protein
MAGLWKFQAHFLEFKLGLPAEGFALKLMI